MQIGGGKQLHLRSEITHWNMVISVKSMIRYVVHILYHSNHENYFCDKILIRKVEAIGNLLGTIGTCCQKDLINVCNIILCQASRITRNIFQKTNYTFLRKQHS
jgi:hypothetical protein